MGKSQIESYSQISYLVHLQCSFREITLLVLLLLSLVSCKCTVSYLHTIVASALDRGVVDGGRVSTFLPSPPLPYPLSLLPP